MTKTKQGNYWIIDFDYLAHRAAKAGEKVPVSPCNDNAVGMMGPRNCPEDTAPLTQKFRILDDDGEVYYQGRMLPFDQHDDESDGFEPLDHFGAPNAGATELQYWKPGKGGGWTTL